MTKSQRVPLSEGCLALYSSGSSCSTEFDLPLPETYIERRSLFLIKPKNAKQAKVTFQLLRALYQPNASLLPPRPPRELPRPADEPLPCPSTGRLIESSSRDDASLVPFSLIMPELLLDRLEGLSVLESVLMFCECLSFLL